jgi:hypothetical protein
VERHRSPVRLGRRSPVRCGRRLRPVAAGALATAACAFACGSATATASSSACRSLAAPRELAPVLSLDPRPHAPRLFAMQYRQSAANVVSYASFRADITCLLQRYVLHRLARGRPNVVVFNEDIGLATAAIGTRGEAARNLFDQPDSPSCFGEGEPCDTLAALGALSAGYALPLAAYHARFAQLGGLGQVFLGATDTIVRGFMATFSELARHFGIYMVGSADVAPFRQSSDPADLAAFSDPDLAPRPSSVYVATAPDVYNEVFMWGPRDVRRSGPDVLRNAVAWNLKVPLTPLESELGLEPGPSTGAAALANLRPYRLPGTRARIGFATSLPAFTYGTPSRGSDPCGNTALYYMRCLNRLGANLVIQDEANPGLWSGPDGDGVEQWQPLSWMASVYRAVSDPSVDFTYSVNPMMVGNLADLPFDGQSAITERGLRLRRGQRGCHYVGNARFVPGEDEAQFRAYAGDKPDFLAIAPWAAHDGPRAALRATGESLAPGSGSSLSDDYVETALIADLPFPPDRTRRNCAG